MQRSLTYYATECEHIEEELDLFELTIDGLPIWERVRFGILRTVQERDRGIRVHGTVARSLMARARGLVQWIKGALHQNPYVVGERDLVFIGHPRRKQEADGLWWDIYCDPIHEACGYDYVHLESPYMLGHRQPPKTECVSYLDVIHYSYVIQRSIGYNEPELPEHVLERLQIAEAMIESRYDVSVKVVDQVRRNLQERKAKLWMFERLLDRLRPKVVVIVTSYTNEIMIEACKTKGITTVELQHGVIYPAHLGYSYRGDRGKRMAPDYMFTFGEFWSKLVEFPVPDERVLPAGFPYLEVVGKKYRDMERLRRIIFISQGLVGEELSRFACEVSMHDSIDYDVIYKLHPGEYNRWEEEYPWLVGGGVEVVESDDTPLYELLATSEIQIGVGSTALYEGLYFDLETYVLEGWGWEPLAPMIEQGIVRRVATVGELAEYIGGDWGGEKGVNKDDLFRPGSVKRVCEWLRLLAEGDEEVGVGL